MNIALLGADEDLLALAEAAVARGDAIVQVVEPGEYAERLRDLAPRATTGVSWESLLAPSSSDVVFVAPGEDAKRLEQLRRLVQEKWPVLAIYPVTLDLLFHYEIDIIARDLGGVVASYSPDMHDAFLDRMASCALGNEASIGEVVKVTFERRMSDFGREAVLRQFAQDALIMQRLVPGLDRLTALGSSGPGSNDASLVVQLTAPEHPPVHWSVARPGGDVEFSVTVEGTLGKATWTAFGDGTRQFAIRQSNAEQPTCDQRHETATPDDMLRELDAQIDNAAPQSTSESPTWNDATRAMEFTDTIEISLRKSRTIYVHAQDVTETTIFRGRMAMYGCGLLFLVLASLLAAPLVGKTAFVVVLAVLVLFLLLQFVMQWVVAVGSDAGLGTTQE